METVRHRMVFSRQDIKKLSSGKKMNNGIINCSDNLIIPSPAMARTPKWFLFSLKFCHFTQGSTGDAETPRDMHRLDPRLPHTSKTSCQEPHHIRHPTARASSSARSPTQQQDQYGEDCQYLPTLGSPEEGPCGGCTAIKGVSSSTWGSPNPRAATTSMKLLTLLLFFLGLALASCNLAQFGQMIKKKTGKSPLAYNGYGCYCGWGGSKQPVDATDRCCQAHDCCYKKLVSSGCSPKTATYKYSFQGTLITCGTGNRCQRETCVCDKRAVECFQRAASSYSKSYHNYPKSKCKGRTPSC